MPPAAVKPSHDTADSTAATSEDVLPSITESEELVEKEIRDRFKRMCEGYFESVSKKLVIEHNVSMLRLEGHLPSI
jgi:regulator of nonsense transcripts 2